MGCNFDYLEALKDCCRDEAAFIKLKQILNSAKDSQKQSEEALRQSKARQRALVNAIPDLLFWIGRDGTYLDFKADREIDFAIPPRQMLGKNVRDVLPKAIADQRMQQIELALQTGKTQIFEYQLSNRGELCDYEARVVASGLDEVLVIVRNITERKRAERQLREREAQYRSIFEETSDGLVVCNLDGFVVEANPAACQMFGYAYEELLGLHQTAFVCPNSHSLVEGFIQRVEHGEQFRSRLMALRKDSSSFHIDAIGLGFTYMGKPHTLGMIRDITEQVQAEEALRQSEEKFSKAFRSGPNPIAISTLSEGRFVEVNDILLELFGYRREEVIGQTAFDLNIWVNLDDRTRLVRHLQEQGNARNLECNLRTKSGNTIVCLVSAEVINLNNELCMLAAIGDITDRKRMEEQLLRMTSDLQSIFQAFPDLQFRLDADGRVLDYHAGAKTDLYVPPQEFLDKRIQEFLPPDVGSQIYEALQEVLTTGEMVSVEYALPSSDRESLMFEARLLPLLENQTIAIVRDVTERKRAEAALRDSEEKFSKAFRSSPGTITVTTLREGRYIEVNDTFLRLTGYKREEVIGRTTAELSTWADLEDRQSMRKILQEKGFVHNVEYKFRQKSGEIGIGLFSAEIIDFEGEPCILAMTNDITDRKRAEAHLKAASERDRLLSEIAMRIRRSLNLDQIFYTTVHEVRQFLQADRVFIAKADSSSQCKIAAESVDYNWPSIIGWVGDESFVREMEGIFQLGAAVVDDVTQVQLSTCRSELFQAYKIKAALAVPVLAGDRVLGALVVHQCAGTRHWHQFEVELLEKLATQVGIAIQQAELYEQVQALNTNLERQVQERTVQLEQKLKELQELSEMKDFFLHAVSHDLRTPIMGMLLLLKNLLNKSCQSSENTLQRTESASTQDVGCAEISSLSHAITNCQQPTNVRLSPPGEANNLLIPRATIERMIYSSDRQLEMLNLLLDSHALEMHGNMLETEAVCLNELLEVVVTDLEPILDKNQARLTNRIPANLPYLHVDRPRVRRLLENLIVNALKHNPPGLHITIDAKVENACGSGSPVHWKSRKRKKEIASDSQIPTLPPMVRCTLQDDGIGLEECDRLFELYTKGKHAKYSTGIGLGLYLCRQIVEAHGGQIGSIGSPGKGATFWFTLPVFGSLSRSQTLPQKG